jgi:hypothetical protein
LLELQRKLADRSSVPRRSSNATGNARRSGEAAKLQNLGVIVHALRRVCVLLSKPREVVAFRVEQGELIGGAHRPSAGTIATMEDKEDLHRASVLFAHNAFLLALFDHCNDQDAVIDSLRDLAALVQQSLITTHATAERLAMQREVFEMTLEMLEKRVK